MIYTTKDDVWQVRVEPRHQGLDVQVSFWDGEDFQVRYDKLVILADSWYEAMTDALTESGFGDWEKADYQVNSWGITPPDDEEEEEN